MRPLLVEGDWGRMIIDCGAGERWTPKERDIYAFAERSRLDEALATAGLSRHAIDVALASHLHFDHFGGALDYRGGSPVARFPRARYVIRAAEWEDATHTHERNRASYRPNDFVPLQHLGAVDFFEHDSDIRPGVRVQRTGGHTGQHQIVYIESGNQTAVFTADLIPTVAHIDDPWIMGYDLFPVETLAFKKRFIREAIEREYLIVFEHDPQVDAGYIRERDGRRYVEPLK
jgi:glyoxylase-like metal-dependent hydrolase (beta-lactamase superfamily II)